MKARDFTRMPCELGFQLIVFCVNSNVRQNGMSNPNDHSASAEATPLSLRDLQTLIRQMYGAKDEARGVEGTFMWLMEEVGELSAALREGDHEALTLEFADVLAWLATIANVAGVDLEAAIRKKYGSGCPGCGQFLCRCDISAKP